MNHNIVGVEEHGFVMTMNMFGDMTEAEFKQRLGYVRRPKSEKKNYATFDKEFKAPAS